MAKFPCRWMRDFILPGVETWWQALEVRAQQGKEVLLHISHRFIQHHPAQALQRTLPRDAHPEQGLSRRGTPVWGASSRALLTGARGSREGQGAGPAAWGFPLSSWGISCATCRSAGEGSQRLCCALQRGWVFGTAQGTTDFGVVLFWIFLRKGVN